MKLILSILLLAFFLNSTIALSWTDSTCSYMAITSYSAFPEDLKLVLNKHRKEFVAGSKYNLSQLSKTELNSFILKKQKEIEKTLKHGKNFKSIAYNLGILAKAISLVSYPFSGQSDFISNDYKLYAERKVFKFYYAYSPIFQEDIEKISLGKKIKTLSELANSFKSSIKNDYKFFKKSQNFDDLSASFGAASILFSDTCLTISQSVANIWQKAGGKVSGVPFFN